MSFNLYLAGSKVNTQNDIIIKRECDVLFSQINDRKAIMKFLEVMSNNKLFIDSGAYSAWSKNKHIDVEDYIKFINDNTDKFTLFASVDDIPGELKRKPTLLEQRESPEKSWHNYLYMREQVRDKDKLLPVFHIGEDFRHLQNMLEATFNNKHIPYIGLGGTVGLASSVKEDWYKQCFKIIQQSKNPKVKVAGEITFHHGKIYEIDVNSGHYKPNVKSLKKAENILYSNFNNNMFSKNSRLRRRDK